jgi:D-glycero-beta-D-manno-heptose-7-phosphate kinase
MPTLSSNRVQKLLRSARQTRVLVIGDVMLDQFLWGRVARISPEAPVPVVEFESESFMPGGAANVARNLADLEVPVELFGVVGRDEAARKLRELLDSQHIGRAGIFASLHRNTSVKTRIIAHQQQVVRVDRESYTDVEKRLGRRILAAIEAHLPTAGAMIVGDYGKGVVTQELLDQLKRLCRAQGLWLSLDPKPVHHLDLSELSLITPNRKEVFELAGQSDGPAVRRVPNPLQDRTLLRAVDKIFAEFNPAVLLVTLGDQGMLLCQRKKKPFHIPTAAQEVFDVSGAGDTVIATFTLAIAAGASPVEAAILSNHAAGVVVGKIGTATVHPPELIEQFKSKN